MFYAGCIWGRSPGRRSAFDVDGGSSDLLDGIQGGGGSPHHARVEGSFHRGGRREMALSSSQRLHAFGTPVQTMDGKGSTPSG